MIDISTAGYLVSRVHAKTGEVLRALFYRPLVRPRHSAKNLQDKHVCLHMRVSSPGSFCNCSCPAVRARLQRMHVSRPSSVWLALKHRECFDCIGGCAVTSGDTKGETENTRVSCTIKVREKTVMIKIFLF